MQLSDDHTKVDDFFSAKSVFSDASLSLESLAASNNETNDLVQRIIALHDKRYEATCKLNQCRFRFNEIDKRQNHIISKSTLEQDSIQKEYSVNDENLKELLKEGELKLQKIDEELKQIDDEVNSEREKLTELEDQIELLKKKVDEKCVDDLDFLKEQLNILEHQYETKNKEFEDLEFKLLELEAKKEDDRAIIQRDMIEHQKKFLDSTRDQKLQDQILDEKQLQLMISRRKEFDKLESDRNACHQQMQHYETIMQHCSNKVQELTNQLDSGEFEELMMRYQSNKNIPYTNLEASTDEYALLSDFSTATGISIPSSNTSVYPYVDTSASSYASPQVSSLETRAKQLQIQQTILQQQLNTLTQIIQSQCYNNNSGTPSSVIVSCNQSNCCNGSQSQLSNRVPNGGSIFSIDDVSSQHTNGGTNDTVGGGGVSLANTIQSNGSITQQRNNNNVTFDYTTSSSVGESLSSSHSPLPTDESLLPTKQMEDSNQEPQVIHRRSKRIKQKQARPLTCFLPKLSTEFSLVRHIESCGHSVSLLESHVTLDSTTCQGYLWLHAPSKLFKRGTWKRRWFYFNHTNRQFTYYKSKTKNKIKGAIDFKDITDVYIDHSMSLGNQPDRPVVSKSNSKKCFCIETMITSGDSDSGPSHTYSLMCARPELVTLWVDVVFTGAEGYLRLHHPSMLNSINNSSSFIEEEI